jgi:hypothetical protein
VTRPRFQLTPEQYALLTAALDDGRVGKNPKGFSHLEAWDVRRWLIRIFGFGGYDTETIALDLVKEIESAPGTIKYGNGGSNTKTVWTVVYRAQVRLTVYDQFGGHAVYEDGACGDSTNQPSLGDCHDNAMKTALSQALKRCVVNLGDQFGLSLYNGGRVQPVVNRSLVAPESPSSPGPALPADDAPVLPEPGTEQPAELTPEETNPEDAPAEFAAEQVDKPAQRRDSRITWNRQQRPGRTPAEIAAEAIQPDTTAARLRELYTEMGSYKAALVEDEQGHRCTIESLLLRLGREAAAREAGAAAVLADERTHRRMHALWRQAGITDRDQRLAFTAEILGHAVTTSRGLTPEDAAKVIDRLTSYIRQQEPAGAAA